MLELGRDARWLRWYEETHRQASAWPYQETRCPVPAVPDTTASEDGATSPSDVPTSEEELYRFLLALDAMPAAADALSRILGRAREAREQRRRAAS
jgi:hypothetical protein